MFLVTAILTASGAVVPGAVAIVAPIGLGFAIQYGINPVLMGLLIINGATAGGFSPISVFGSIVNGVVERNDLAENATLLFVSSFVFNLLLQRRRLLHLRRARAARPARRARREGEPTERAPTRQAASGRRAERARPRRSADLDRDKILTLIGIVTLIVVALAFDVDVGFVALSDRRRAVAHLAEVDQGRRQQGRVADGAADLRHRDVRRPAREHRHDRLARRAGRDDRRGAASPRC